MYQSIYLSIYLSISFYKYMHRKLFFFVHLFAFKNPDPSSLLLPLSPPIFLSFCTQTLTIWYFPKNSYVWDRPSSSIEKQSFDLICCCRPLHSTKHAPPIANHPSPRPFPCSTYLRLSLLSLTYDLSFFLDSLQFPNIQLPFRIYQFVLIYLSIYLSHFVSSLVPKEITHPDMNRCIPT